MLFTHLALTATFLAIFLPSAHAAMERCGPLLLKVGDVVKLGQKHREALGWRAPKGKYAAIVTDIDSANHAVSLLPVSKLQLAMSIMEPIGFFKADSAQPETLVGTWQYDVRGRTTVTNRKFKRQVLHNPSSANIRNAEAGQVVRDINSGDILLIISKKFREFAVEMTVSRLSASEPIGRRLTISRKQEVFAEQPRTISQSELNKLFVTHLGNAYEESFLTKIPQSSVNETLGYSSLEVGMIFKVGQKSFFITGRPTDHVIPESVVYSLGGPYLPIRVTEVPQSSAVDLAERGRAKVDTKALSSNTHTIYVGRFQQFVLPGEGDKIIQLADVTFQGRVSLSPRIRNKKILEVIDSIPNNYKHVEFPTFRNFRFNSYE